MKIDKAEAIRLTSNLTRAVKEFSDFLNTAPAQIPEENEQLRNRFKEIAAAQSELENLLGVSGQVVEFSDFFSSVGQALVHAQESMDEQSEAYLKLINKRPHILPSVFRIPKLSAEIKFAFKEVKGEKVNLIFFSKQEAAETLHQQSVQFDILSIPPPQEIINLPLRVDLVLSTERRRSIFAKIRQFQLAKDSTGRRTESRLNKSILLINPDRVLILEPEPLKIGEAEPVERFYLLYAEGKDEKNIGVWHIRMNPLLLEVIYKFSREPLTGEIIRPLHDDVLRLGLAQAEILKHFP